MRDVAEAIQWSGSGATVSLFVVMQSSARPAIAMVHPDVVPARVRYYSLDDPDGRLEGCEVHEFDAEFVEPPPGLGAYLERCLKEALVSGATVAWLGFEGSFDLEHLLTDDVASVIYGVGDSRGISVALQGVERQSSEWAARVRACRSSLPGQAPK